MQSKYFVIYQEIANKIDKGDYKAKEYLPSEHELCTIYGTARETIRKALNLLAENGYIQKIRGKGSLVIDRNKFDLPVSGLVSFREITDKMDEKPLTVVHECNLEKVTPKIAQQLKVSSQELVWEVKRTRQFSGEHVILDKDYFLEKYVPKLTEDIASRSIYDYLENTLGLSISFAKKEITVIEPTEEDKDLLDLEGFQHIVVIKNYVYLDDATLFQYTESRHRPDKFRFVDFARRNR